MYDRLKVHDKTGAMLKPYHHMSVGKDFKLDALMWKEFLSLPLHSGQLCRPFTDWNHGFSVQQLNFYTDSSHNPDLGMGGVFGNLWICERWPKGFVESCKPSIEFLELFTLCAGVLTWSHLLKNGRIIVFNDNQAVVGMVNNMTSKCPFCMKLLRLLALDNMISNRRMFVNYVRSCDNILADSLSHLDFNRFWENAPITMDPKKCTLNDNLWPVQQLWDN